MWQVRLLYLANKQARVKAQNKKERKNQGTGLNRIGWISHKKKAQFSDKREQIKSLGPNFYQQCL